MLRGKAGRAWATASFLILISLVAVGSAARIFAQTMGSTAIARTSAGGPRMTTGGVTWSADQYFSGGRTCSNQIAIASTTDDVFYQTEHNSGLDKGSFSCNIPVPTNCSYTVKLHFAEIYWGAPNGGTGGLGKRVIDVNQGGTLEPDNVDIFSEVGPSTAIVKTFTTTVSDGTLDIVLTGVAD